MDTGLHALVALAGLSELLRYFGPALTAAGWNGCNLLRTRVTAAQGDVLKPWA